LAQGFVALDGPTATLRRAAHALETGAARLPIGRMKQWPGKAFRRIDRIDAFKSRVTRPALVTRRAALALAGGAG
jgi:hypothetical protein